MGTDGLPPARALFAAWMGLAWVVPSASDLQAVTDASEAKGGRIINTSKHRFNR